jgi:diguanylate cyclase (GGDEF)-like protein
MTTRRLWLTCAGLAGLVAAVVALDSSPLLSKDAAVVVDDAAQFAAGAAAAVACWWTARGRTGPERTWRRCMAVGMAGWTLGQVVWSWYQIVTDTPLPSPSWADVGYLTLPVLALPAFVALAAARPPGNERRRSMIVMLDWFVVLGSLFVLTWATALGTAVHSAAPSALAYVVAIAYPVTDLVLVAVVVILAVTRRVADPLRLQLGLLGAGLVALSVSDSIFAYLVSTGAPEMPPLTNAGFIAGPLAIAVAAVAPAGDGPVGDGFRARRRGDLAHLLLPIVLVAVAAAFVATQNVLGVDVDPVEASFAYAVIAVFLVRQVVASVQMSRAQHELDHRAHHDPLTGLANRALLADRLRLAVERHGREGRPFALIVLDLDDFKDVNDSLGHRAGDRVLQAAGERLGACVRASDTVARPGGDEFAVLVDGAGEAPDQVGRRLLAALREPFAVDGATVRVTASFGIVRPEADEHPSADELMHRADIAMYAGKRAGKDTLVHYRVGMGGDLPLAAR